MERVVLKVGGERLVLQNRRSSQVINTVPTELTKLLPVTNLDHKREVVGEGGE